MQLSSGWALMPFLGERVHYWNEDKSTMPPTISDGCRVRYYESLCGLRSMLPNKGAPALNPGNWPKCKNCQRIKRKG